MKTIILLLFWIVALQPFQSSIYDIQLKDLDNNSITLSSYKGKKILVYSFNANNPNSAQLLYLDSLQKGNNFLSVLAVPATDFSANFSEPSLKGLRDSLSLSFLFTKPALVKKNDKELQSPLMKWLTKVSENTHFDRDVEADEQFFIINEKGTLYGVLGKGVPKQVISKVLNEGVKE